MKVASCGFLSEDASDFVRKGSPYFPLNQVLAEARKKPPSHTVWQFRAMRRKTAGVARIHSQRSDPNVLMTSDKNELI